MDRMSDYIDNQLREQGKSEEEEEEEEEGDDIDEEEEEREIVPEGNTNSNIMNIMYTLS